MVNMRSTLAVGRYGGATAAGLEAASRAAGLDFNQVDTIVEALSWAEQHEPHSLLLDGANGSLERACLEVRAQVRHALVPIIALSPEVNELAFAEVFSCGGDDVVGASSDAVVRLSPDGSVAWSAPFPGVAAVLLEPGNRVVAAAPAQLGAGRYGYELRRYGA